MTAADVKVREELAQLGLPAPDQIGFVVRDLDQAIAHYDPLFGPFSKTDYGPQKASYQGRSRSAYELKFAFGRIGDLEIELIEWISGDTPHRDFLEKGRDGMHHLRFRVDDLDQWAAKLQAKGYETVWHDRLSPHVAFGYFERDDDPLVLELLQYPEDGDPTTGT
ncbi:VOC family protein [Sphingobium estronivorans]|uniref:VOC family protein n=1 Tax=Sphingobium estronivorans TaxID=1577690 RepID=UPI0013C330F3|nr:VOC family protein [Sphingobium estronivorans]